MSPYKDSTSSEQPELLTPQRLRSRFNAPSYRPKIYPEGERENLGDYRGDHNLNPGLFPVRGPDGHLKAAAVLVPVIARPQGLQLLLTKRTDHLTHHPGQICFPGGRVETYDQDPVDTALRETEEELGLSPKRVTPVGRLDDYITRTGFIVAPVVGLIQPPLSLQPDPNEVADTFEVPLSFILDTANHQRCNHLFEGKTRYYYAIPYGDYFIWGATAGMLINLYQYLTATTGSKSLPR
jgi:8-oxo-dGTP pyrophosphatase MutT (NUDIX family)